MPSNSSQLQGPRWVTLNDFRPGIKGRVSPSFVLQADSKVLGAASKEGTFRCWALPDGSLGPMPKRIAELKPTLPIASSLTTTGRLTVSGFHSAGPIVGGSEFHVAYEYIKTAGTRRAYYWQRIRHFDADQIDTLYSIDPTAENPAVGFAQPTWFHTSRADDTDPTVAGTPIVVAAWRESGGTGFWKTFPNPATPTLNTPFDIVTTFTKNPYMSFPHQGRSVIINLESWNHGTTTTFPWVDSEQFWFTESSTVVVDNTLPQLFQSENATGYSVALSTSYSELFLIKNVQGGVLIRGDIADPTVLRLPSIPGLANRFHTATSCPLGAVFLSDAGVWLWNGAESAENISADALTHDDIIQVAAGTDNDFQAYCGRCYYWNDLVFIPNNWAWDWKQRSWWRLEDPDDVLLFHLGPEEVGVPTMYAAPSHVATGETVIYSYQYNTPADSYQWQSLPLPINDDRFAKLREINLVATGTGNISVIFTDRSNVDHTYTFTIANDNVPTWFRHNISVEIQHLLVRFEVDNNTVGTTPVIHELHMLVEDTQHSALA